MSDRLRRCAGVLAVTAVVALPAVLGAGAAGSAGESGAGSPVLQAADAGSGATATRTGTGIPDGVAIAADGTADPAAPGLPVTREELLATMVPPGAGPAAGDVFAHPPGTVPVRRAGEDGLTLSWALLDTAADRWAGSANADTDRTEAESTIKAWLAADTLRAAAEAGRAVTAAERADIAAAVRASDDAAAERLYRALGRDASIARLDTECGVAVSTPRPGWWSFTRLTAVDAARILACVRDRAPEWPGGTELLADLAALTPDGRSGIHTGLPGEVAEKNGWTLHGHGEWNLNCVLAWRERALAVLLTYPAARGAEYGWAVCRDVADDVLDGAVPPAGAPDGSVLAGSVPADRAAAGDDTPAADLG
ncbi:hypothetical protein [Pseudonocardia parietis]|uniref:Beta-lactamase family protein n=1 Tax=Pseudonocardia parietis TaxID=570936 RepID=A0ABS4VYW4_9PSEU|nr:hypothetical protein [Pseudonocardia parietis]MBP2369063.1 hypothetical protein [Pseudonocardia parietis]